MANKTAREILNSLVMPRLPFPLSVPKEFAVKCAKKAEKDIDQALLSLCDLIIPNVCSSCKESVRKVVGVEK